MDYTQRDTCLSVPRGHFRRRARTEDLHAAGGDGLPSTDCAGADRAGRRGDRRPGDASRRRDAAPFPANELYDFPNVLDEVLPLLPAPLEYRLIDHDLVIRDVEADVIVAVLRDAIGTDTTRR